ncbi:MAG: YezD family protein [Nitrospirota bacterium]
MESIGEVKYGSVEIKIQDSKVVQIDVLEKRRLTENG